MDGVVLVVRLAAAVQAEPYTTATNRDRQPRRRTDLLAAPSGAAWAASAPTLIGRHPRPLPPWSRTTPGARALGRAGLTGAMLAREATLLPYYGA